MQPFCDSKPILEYYRKLSMRAISQYAERKVRLKVPLINEAFLENIIKQATEYFRHEEVISHVSSPSIVVGNINGNILGLLPILNRFFQSTDEKFIFVGNTTGKCEYSLEVLSILYILKVTFPYRIFIIRGANEFTDRCLNTSLPSNIQSRYGTTKLFNQFCMSFSFMPIAAVLDQKYFIVQGGPGSNCQRVDFIIDRPIEKMNDIIGDLLCSSPSEKLPFYMPQPREKGCFYGSKAIEPFLKSAKCQILIRSLFDPNDDNVTCFDGLVYTLNTDSSYQTAVAIVDAKQINVITSPPVHQVKRADILFVGAEDDDTSSLSAYKLSKLPPLKSQVKIATSTSQHIPVRKTFIRNSLSQRNVSQKLIVL